MIVVADSGPLIHLSLIGRLDLLPGLYGKILIPEGVHDEVVKSGEGLPGSLEVAAADWITVVKHNSDLAVVRLLRGDLDAGEAAAIGLAIDRKADWLLSDDRPARLAAERLGLKVRGTLGILVMAKSQGLIAQVAPLAYDLRDQGVWLGEELIKKVLQRIGESP